MSDQLSMFTVRSGHDGGAPRYEPNVARPHNPGFSEAAAAKRRKHNSDVAHHLFESARVLDSPLKAAVLAFVDTQSEHAFRLSKLYAHVDEVQRCSPDTPRRVLTFLRDEGLVTVENPERGLFVARLTEAGRAALRDGEAEGVRGEG